MYLVSWSSKLELVNYILRFIVPWLILVKRDNCILFPGRDIKLILEDCQTVQVADLTSSNNSHPFLSIVIASLYVIQIGIHPVHMP